jgi:hypothetical protein
MPDRVNENMLKTILYLSLTLFYSVSYAQYDSSLYSKYKRFSFELQYSTFSDIVQTSSEENLELSNVIGGNANFRIYRTFSLSFAYGKATDSSFEYKGLGFRIDLPGIFLISGNPNEMVRKSKKHRFNSYFAAMKLLTTSINEPDDFVSDKFGFGLDAFITNSFYINTEVNLFSYKGNQFVTPVIGIGVEF